MSCVQSSPMLPTRSHLSVSFRSSTTRSATIKITRWRIISSSHCNCSSMSGRVHRSARCDWGSMSVSGRFRVGFGSGARVSRRVSMYWSSAPATIDNILIYSLPIEHLQILLQYIPYIRTSLKMYHSARNGYAEAPSSTAANPNRTL